MTKRVLVVAVHPDDETLGCGGTLLRHVRAGHEVHWLIVTGISTEREWPAEMVQRRSLEIRAVAEAYPFAGVHALDFPAAQLDRVPLSKLVAGMGSVFEKIRPDTLYLPHRGDAHSDHRTAFQAATAAAKVFRQPSISQILSFETLSETDVVPSAEPSPFQPNFFVDIGADLERKIQILSAYQGEIQSPPFPRSVEAVRALALLRGGQCGSHAAEAFMLLRGKWSEDAP